MKLFGVDETSLKEYMPSKSNTTVSEPPEKFRLLDLEQKSKDAEEEEKEEAVNPNAGRTSVVINVSIDDV